MIHIVNLHAGDILTGCFSVLVHILYRVSEAQETVCGSKFILVKGCDWLRDQWTGCEFDVSR